MHKWSVTLPLTNGTFSKIRAALLRAGFDNMDLKVINSGSNAQYWIYHTRASAMTEFVLKHEFAFEYAELA